MSTQRTGNYFAFPAKSLKINGKFMFCSGGRKMPQNKPMGAANRQPQKAIPGRPFKVSDEITIIPQGKNTQANKPKVFSNFYIFYVKSKCNQPYKPLLFHEFYRTFIFSVAGGTHSCTQEKTSN